MYIALTLNIAASHTLMDVIGDEFQFQSVEPRVYTSIMIYNVYVNVSIQLLI